MGTVYRAVDESLGRPVAVKLVRDSDAEDPASRERLRREACSAGRLNHPRVAQVYALNFSNGHPFLVMELVSGEDFSRRLEREGRIDERTALNMALDVAEGLSALNREGLIHGDIKPGNIVVDREGHAKLVDFGLSGMKRTDSKGKLVGTPNYIAPELLRGAADTHRSDLYSLGATLYHLLVGRPPAEGEKTIDVLKARLLGTPILIYKVGGHLSMPTRKLLMHMLETDPSKRPADSDAVAAEIRDALSQLEAPAPAKPAISESLRQFLAALQAPPQPAASRRPLRASIIIIFGPVIVALELLVAVPSRSFSKTWELLRSRLSPEADATAASVSAPAPAQPLPPQQFTLGGARAWQSMNLGSSSLRGSTMRRGGTLIIQGPGADRTKDEEGCRFVWTRAANDFALSALVRPNADNNPLSSAGLLVKGADPALGPSLFFGILGTGELILQQRHPGSPPSVLKRSERPAAQPCHLKLTRRGAAFEASFSSDGRTWETFSAGKLELPAENAIGFSVSAQDPATLATGSFGDVRVL
jgi:serine/threonine protein kinase